MTNEFSSTLLGLYSIYDKKAQNFGAPFEAQTDEEAIRISFEVATTNGCLVNRYPDDYVLYRIGMFSKRVGTIQSSLLPDFINEVATILSDYKRIYNQKNVPPTTLPLTSADNDSKEDELTVV